MTRITNDKRRTTDKGFTLIEILLTIVILTVGVIAVTGAFNAGFYASSDIENVNLALNIARAKMENIKDTPFADLSDSASIADPDFPNFATTVNVAEGQNPMQVDTTVAWQAKGGQASVTLTTLVADY